MRKRSFLAAGVILTAVCLTACGSGGSKESETETTTQAETVVAQAETTTAEQKVITDKNASSKNTEKETTTRAAEQETTTKAVEKETTTKEKETEAPVQAPAAAGNTDTADDASDDYYGDEAGGYTGVINADGSGLTLREGPDSDSENLTIIPDGTEVEILDVQDNWGYINYGGMEGWIFLDYVQ